MKDDFGNRMKKYEKEDSVILDSNYPIFARLDGRAFHTFTKGLKRPFDERFRHIMVETAKFVFQESNALFGYTQSDEITLMWNKKSEESQIFFNGKVQKMASVLASLASVKFNQLIATYLPEKAGRYPVFDCRVWKVPSVIEAVNVFIWRIEDASRNSISAVAQNNFSHKEMHKKKCVELKEMLMKKGVNWENYDLNLRYGTYIKKCEDENKIMTRPMFPFWEANDINRVEFIFGKGE